MVDRRTLLAGAGTAGLAALGGCVFWREDRSPQPDQLVILSGSDDSEGAMRHELAEGRWNEDPDRVPASIHVVGGVADAQRSEMVARAQSGRAGVDIYNLDATWTAEFAQAGYLRPLDTTGLDTSAFLDGPLRTCRYEGQLWALPFNSDAGLLYYRSDLIPPERAPTDWGGIELRTRAQFAATERVEELLAGYAGQLADYEGLTVNALEMIWAEHGEVATGDWRDPQVWVDSGPVADAMRRLARAFSEEDPQLILPDSAEFDEAATTTAFKEGKVLFMRNWPVAARILGRRSDPVSDAAPDGPPFRVRRLPGPSVLGGQNLAIAVSSTRPEDAQQLIEFLTSHDSQRDLFRAGGLPATRGDVYDDPAVAAEEALYAPVVREAIQMARPRPVTPYYSRFSEVFRHGVRRAMRNGGEIPDGFADELARAMQGLR